MGFYTIIGKELKEVPFNKVETLMNNGITVLSDKDITLNLEQQLQEKQKLLDEARDHIINILSCSNLSSESSKTYYNNEAKDFISKLNNGEG